MSALLLSVFIIGLLTGCRAFTPFAVICWAAHFGWIRLEGTSFAWLSSTVAVGVVSVIALGELVGDKLPKTPNRTAIGPLLGRIVIGGLCGVLLSLGVGQSWFAGAAVAAVSAIGGAFGGFHLRRALVHEMKLPDLAVALVEDAITIGGALFVVSHLR